MVKMFPFYVLSFGGQNAAMIEPKMHLILSIKQPYICFVSSFVGPSRFFSWVRSFHVKGARMLI